MPCRAAGLIASLEPFPFFLVFPSACETQSITWNDEDIVKSTFCSLIPSFGKFISWLILNTAVGGLLILVNLMRKCALVTPCSALRDLSNSEGLSGKYFALYWGCVELGANQTRKQWDVRHVLFSLHVCSVTGSACYYTLMEKMAQQPRVTITHQQSAETS